MESDTLSIEEKPEKLRISICFCLLLKSKNIFQAGEMFDGEMWLVLILEVISQEGLSVLLPVFLTPV